MALWDDVLARFRQDDGGYEEDEYEEYSTYDTSSSAVTEEEAAPRFSANRSDKVINMHGGFRGSFVKLLQPAKYEDVMKEPVRFLRENMSVVLNLDHVTADARMRIVDFMAGVIAAVDGKMVKVAACTYIVAPKTVDLSGDMVDYDQF